MKIIKLIAENVKGLKAIEIVPDEHFQLIGGKNGQGKSSVLDSIWLAVGGKDAAKGTEKPIRNGEESAFATVDLGDIVVTRKWKGDNTTLEVKSKDGAKYNSPQTMLDNLIGKLSFDPLAFANLDEKKQKATLQEIVGIDFTELDKKRKGIYEDRTEVNREMEKYKALLLKLPYPKDGTPDEEVKATDIINQITAAQTNNRENDKKREKLVSLRGNLESVTKEIDELKRQLQQKEDEKEAITIAGKALKDEIAGLTDTDITELQHQLEQVETTNQNVRELKEYRKAEQQFELCQTDSKKYTKDIEDIDQLKQDTLQAAAFPIAGLSFDESGVTFNGIPFKQCSAAERLKVSMAMAMALNPKLRVIRILDGSLLDADNLALIHEMAKEKDYQVWVEVVDSSGTVGVNIENGQIKEV